MAISINTQAIPGAFLETLTDTEFRSQGKGIIKLRNQHFQLKPCN